MKTICFFSGDITRAGGTEKVTIQIANGLCKKYNVIILSLQSSNNYTFFKLDDCIKRYSMFKGTYSSKKDYFKIISRLHHFINKMNIDLVINADTMLDIYTVFAKKFTKAKLISWEHFNFYETLGNKHRMFVRKHITKHSDCVVTLTKEDKNNYNNYFEKSLKVVQIYNPFISEDKDHSYDINSKTIISVGRLAHQKGYDMLIKVAHSVLKKRPDWEWIVLGEGEERNKLEKMIAESGLKKIRLLGKVDNVEDYMRKSAIYVLTSRYEGFPLVLIEAKTNKLPVVAFNCKTGPKELVRNNVNGYLIDCFDINEMANKISTLMDDYELRKKYSDNASLDMAQLEYERIINKWVKLIELISK